MIYAYRNKKKIKPLADSVGAVWITSEELNSNTMYPVIFSGISNSQVVDLHNSYGIDYYYIDTGYFGNFKKKLYKRITKNGMQNCFPIIDRPRDRLDKISLTNRIYRRGKKILIVPPDLKVCNRYNLGEPEQWLSNTTNLIKQHTDREILVRHRTPSRTTRIIADTFSEALANDINAIVTYTSNCAVESILHNIPVVSLGPSATVQVYPHGIECIDNLPNIDLDQKEAWLRHLSYSQFTDEEMSNGVAWRILNER